MRVYSFLPENGRPINSFSGDVIEFFRYLTASHSFPASRQYMLSKWRYSFDSGMGRTLTSRSVSIWDRGCDRRTGKLSRIKLQSRCTLSDEGVSEPICCCYTTVMIRS